MNEMIWGGFQCKHLSYFAITDTTVKLDFEQNVFMQ